MTIIIRIAINGVENIKEVKLSNEHDPTTVQSLFLSTERMLSMCIYQDFNTIFKLISFNVELQDLDGMPIDGVIELTSGRFVKKIPYTVLSYIKTHQKNRTDTINNDVYTYEIKAISIPLSHITDMLRKTSGTIKSPIETLKQQFKNVEINTHVYKHNNYFNLNFIQQIKEITHDLYFNGMASMTVAKVEDDMSNIKISDVLTYTSNKNNKFIYIAESMIAEKFEEQCMYNAYNVNENKNKVTYKVHEDHVKPLVFKMDNKFNLDDNYIIKNRDEIIDSVEDIYDGKVEDNLKLMYSNVTNKTFNIIQGDALRDLELGATLITGDDKHVIVGYMLNLTFDNDLVGGTFQLIDKIDNE